MVLRNLLPRRGERAPSLRTLLGTTPRLERQRRRLTLETLEGRIVLSTSIPLSTSVWTSLGPTSIVNGQTPGNNPVSGKINGVTSDPTNPNVIFVATAGGGIWKSFNGGTSWNSLTDTQSTLFTGSIAVAPSSPNVIYAGTGDSNNGPSSFYGLGVLKSTNSGLSWTLENDGGLFTRQTISKVIVSPSDPNTVYVAVANGGLNGLGGQSGIYKSSDGGGTWTNTTASFSQTDTYSDLVMNPNNPNNLYAAIGTPGGSNKNGVYVTNNGGTSWKLAGNFPGGLPDGRIALGVASTSSSTPAVVYAAITNPTTGVLLSIQKTTDGGVTWTVPYSTAPANYLGNQGYYSTYVAVNPTNPSVLIVAGEGSAFNASTNSVMLSTNGGSTFTDISSDALGNGPRIGHHSFNFDATGNLLDVGDGGIWKLVAPGTANFRWVDLNSNLSIAELNNVALDPGNADLAFAGSQGNGTEAFRDSTNWTLLNGGDGGNVEVDSSTVPLTLYRDTFFKTGSGSANNTTFFQGSFDGGVTWLTEVAGIGTATDNGQAYPPFVLDPSNPNRLLLGTDHVYESLNQGLSWTPISLPKAGTNVFSGWNSNAAVTALAISPADPNTIYAATADGHVFVTSNDGKTWSQHDITINGVDIGGPETSFALDLKDPKIAYTVRAAFNGGTSVGHVFETLNGGMTWTDLTGNLPDLPTWSVAVDSQPGAQEIFVGNDNGVYASADGGATWTPYKAGIPNVQVTDLDLDPQTGILAASTLGRGLYEIKVTPTISVQLISPGTVVAGQALSNITIAEFSDLVATTPPAPASSYVATINWGDGNVTQNATITPVPGGLFDVTGSHTYTKVGTFSVTVSIQEINGESGQSNELVTVADASFTAVPNFTFSPTEGQTFTGQLDTFSYGVTTAPASGFQATIDWGNAAGTGSGAKGTATVSNGVVSSIGLTATGTGYTAPPNVTFVGGGGTGATAVATLAPTGVGSLVVTSGGSGYTTVPFVSLTGGGGFGASAVATIAQGVVTGLVVTNPGTGYTSPPAVFILGGGGSGAVAGATLATTALASITLTSGGTGYTSNPTILISNDNVTPGTIAADPQGGGVFDVSGTNLYRKYGSYPVTIYLSDPAGTQITATGTAQVADASLIASPQTISGVAGTTFSGSVATFVDTNPLGLAGDFSATIDWGDNSPAVAGTIGVSGGAFTVLGSHAYAEARTYHVMVTITDKGGATATPVPGSTANIADAALIATGQALTASKAQPLPATTLIASFTDGNKLAQASDFGGTTIRWGDGVQASATAILTSPTSISFTITNGGSGYQYPPVVTLSGGGFTTQGTATASLTHGIVTGITLTGAAGYTSPPTVTIAPPLSTATASATFVNATTITFNITSGGSGYTSAPVVTVTGGGGTFTSATATINSSGQVTGITLNGATGFTSAPTVTIAPPSEPATVVQTGPGTFNVEAGHTYFVPGDFQISVNIVSSGGSKTVANATASVADVPVSAVGLNVMAAQGQTIVEGAPLINVPVATFTDHFNGLPSYYTPTIDWGDQTGTTVGTVIQDPNIPGQFDVLGTHSSPTYQHAGNFTVTVNIADGGGGSTTVTSTAHVVDAPLTLTPANMNSVVVGNPVTSPVATFTDANPEALPKDFAVTIDWGNGVINAGQAEIVTPITIAITNGGLGYASAPTVTLVGGGGSYTSATATIDSMGRVSGITVTNAIDYTSVPSVVISGGGGTGATATASLVNPSTSNAKFQVVGTNTYTEISGPGQSFPITATVVDRYGNQPYVVNTSATVQDATLSPSSGLVFTPVAGTAFNGVVATFLDGNPLAPASNFQATINFGDGHTGAGTVVSLGNGSFQVVGTNTYATVGTYAVSALITDNAGASGSAFSKAAVAAAPLAAVVSAPVNSFQGTAFSAILVAFNSGNPAASVGQFSATINWGDGAITSGQIIQAGGGVFQVAGSHTYNATGHYSVTVTTNVVGGSPLVQTTTAQVLLPLTGGVTGGSSTNSQPTFTGTAQPGTNIRLFVTPVGNPSGLTLVGLASVSSSGQWAILVNQVLADGTYIVTANNTDAGGQPLASVNLANLVVDTTGPTVAAIAFRPAAQQLQVTFLDTGSGVSASALRNPANYVLSLAGGRGGRSFGVTSIQVVPGASGSGLMTAIVTYNLGRKPAAGNYVVTLRAGGLTDNAGNRLVATTFVKFPQTTNSPDPDYIAAFSVNKRLAASGPSVFIPPGERAAASRFRGLLRALRP
jgi:hypothetical protein